ncbi:MAG: nickel-dependent hydrogenase large subunit [Candidatus Cloacimonadota bacterium]|nr:nickel-dependent hydrogenase large subunit [Candidatus Cloacimonadota bacterium]
MSKCRIPLGPFHPLLEEAEFFDIKVEGEKVVDIEMETGWMHRGHEKLSESMSYTQSIFLVERICGICSTSHPFALVNAIEDIDDIQIPERAKYIRVLIGEIERIHSHLLWLGLAGHFIGYDTLWMWCWKYREPILQLSELVSGNRNHYAMMRVGGVGRDFDNATIPKYHKVLDDLEKQMIMLAGAAKDDPVLRSRLKGVGILTKEDAINYCANGPTARASGVDIDVRRDDPTAYEVVDVNVITLPHGDVYDKLVVRVLEVIDSVKIMRQCLKAFPKVGGPVLNPVKEISPGEGCGRYEAPRGEVFHYIRSDGTNRPLRHKVRAPSFSNIPTYKASCVGIPLADALITLAAVDPCYCCTERTIRTTDVNNKKVDAELLSLSRAKTEKIRKSIMKNDKSPIDRIFDKA